MTEVGSVKTCYIGLCPVCSKVIAAHALLDGIPRDQTAQTIGSWIVNGLKVETHDSADAVHRIGWCEDAEGHIPVWIESSEAAA
jgi:hypothetical protein